MSKPHTKSRFGCKECKQRKIKCDEARPVCTKCAILGRECSYLGPFNVPTPHLTVSTAPSSVIHCRSDSTPNAPSPVYLDPVASSGGIESSATHPSDSSREHYLTERYSLLHLELLHHFKGQLTRNTQCIQPGLELVLDIAYEEALHTPYLMDELLAFSAAHKSTLLGEHQSLYLVESTRLQTRALAGFNEHPEVTDENCVALFIFSTLLGQHVLFDAFSVTVELAAVLDKLTQCIGLHHGIRAIAGRSWQKVSTSFRDRIPVDPAYMEWDITTTTGDECESLLLRLSRSALDQSIIQVYHNAVRILQYIFDSLRSSNSRRFVAVQEWPVRVSKEYVQYLHQRRPEALVIFSYYAVLLHYARDYWAVGGSGKFLIQSIASYLGPYWADWLEWPNQILREVANVK